VHFVERIDDALWLVCGLSNLGRMCSASDGGSELTHGTFVVLGANAKNPLSCSRFSSMHCGALISLANEYDLRKLSVRDSKILRNESTTGNFRVNNESNNTSIHYACHNWLPVAIGDSTL
jgi:hypothetical protein